MSLPPSGEIPQGAIRFNTDSQRLEFYAQGEWWIMSTDTPNLGQGTDSTPGPRGLFTGGYASAAGSPNNGGPLGARKGGTGTANSITGSPVTYAGGGSGASAPGPTGHPGTTVPGGPGGGGDGIVGPSPSSDTDGDANTGGGGGGAWNGTNGAGGSGVVVLRAPGPLGPSFTVAPGTNSKTTLPAPAGGCTVMTFTVTGTLTIS